MIDVLIGYLLCAGTPGFGQTLYKWKDANGKWHFSDKAPADGNTTVEKAALGETNTTSTRETNEHLKKVFPGETPEEAAHRRQKVVQEKEKQARIDEICRQARKRLDIVRGRVIFLDENGKQVQVSEEERRARAIALEKEIKQYCR